MKKISKKETLSYLLYITDKEEKEEGFYAQNQKGKYKWQLTQDPLEAHVWKNIKKIHSNWFFCSAMKNKDRSVEIIPVHIETVFQLQPGIMSKTELTKMLKEKPDILIKPKDPNKKPNKWQKN